MGHDVMNELYARGHECIGSGSAAAYKGIADGSAAARLPYVQMEITDAKQVNHTMTELRPDAVIHCAA